MSHSREYTAYMRSPQWQAKRRAKFAASGKRCAWRRLGRCDGALQVHHWTYKRLGDERLSDLTVLCQRHHRVADRLRRAWVRIRR